MNQETKVESDLSEVDGDLPTSQAIDSLLVCYPGALSPDLRGASTLLPIQCTGPSPYSFLRLDQTYLVH